MSHTLRNLGLAALLAVSASAFMTTNASALSMADCSIKYKAAKAAGTDAGMKWNDFRKAQCGTDATAAPAAPAVATAPAAPAAKMTKAMAPAAPAAAATTPSGSFMKDCSTAWKGMKAANTVPAGMTFKDFVAAKCIVAGAPPAAPAAKVAAPAAPAAPATAATATAPVAQPGIIGKMLGKKATIAPPEPPVAAAPDTTPLATADKNGKLFTPGQMAAHMRISACGEEWRGLKAAGKTPAGTAWPQYWSECNKRLKAAGQ